MQALLRPRVRKLELPSWVSPFAQSQPQALSRRLHFDQHLYIWSLLTFPCPVLCYRMFLLEAFFCAVSAVMLLKLAEERTLNLHAFRGKVFQPALDTKKYIQTQN